MQLSDIAVRKLPEWYIFERDTEKIIKSLTKLKELSFYLKNPDEYIRRLTILRMSELKFKDSIDVLKEIMDDPLESSSNKDLAAWTVKSDSLKWDVDLFIGNRFLNKFVGNEKLDKLFNIKIIGFSPSLNFDLKSTLIDEDIQSNSNNRHIEDINLPMSFPYGEWRRACMKNIANTIKNLALKLPSITLSLIRRIISGILKILFFKIPHTLVSPINKISKLKRKSNSSYGAYHYQKQVSAHSKKVTSIKDAFMWLLYIVFYPIRLVRRHKIFTALILVIFYSFFAYSPYGKALTYKYSSLDLMKIQNISLISAKSAVASIWSKLLDIMSADKTLDSAYNQYENTNTYYSVASKKGIYLRKDPSLSSKKSSTKFLKYKSAVIYLSRSYTDPSGDLWIYVQTNKSLKGWVNSKNLKPSGK